MQNLSIVIPAKNEAEGLKKCLPDVQALYPDAELIVVNDGSEDATASVAQSFGAKVVSHPYSKGNGASIKSGARAATGDYILFMDGDGQHKAEDIKKLIEKAEQGFDMVVGARNAGSQASKARLFGNGLYNLVASKVVGHKIPDLTSGFRLVKRTLFMEFLYLLPNGFSYPTTTTMAFFRSGYSVGFVPIVADERIGKSHINIVRDGIRFMIIIFKIATLYSPLKLFLPLAFFLSCSGLGYYFYTFFVHNRYTNMAMTLLLSGLIVFLMGLISEQITALNYKKEE